MSDSYLAIITGPKSLLRKLKNLTLGIIAKLSRELVDIFKLSNYGVLFDGIYDGLRRIIPLYIFRSGKDSHKIYYYWSIKHSSNFNYNLDSRLVMGDVVFPLHFSDMIYLSADISSLLELILTNMRRNNFVDNLVLIDQLVREISLRSKVNSLKKKIINIHESINDLKKKSAEIISFFLSKNNSVIEGSFSLYLSEAKNKLVNTVLPSLY